MSSANFFGKGTTIIERILPFLYLTNEVHYYDKEMAIKAVKKWEPALLFWKQSKQVFKSFVDVYWFL